MVEPRPERETRSNIPVAAASHDLTSEERRIVLVDLGEDVSEWKVRSFRQVHIPPFKPWCAIAEREVNGKIEMVNAEGDTKHEAEERVKQKVKR